MPLSDSDFRTIVTKVHKLSQQNLHLTVESLLNQPRSHAVTDPVLFTSRFRTEFPDSTLLKSFDITSFSSRADFDPDNHYYAGNVCYVKSEDKTSSGKGYDVQKKNTYSLCPLCDPFAKLGLHEGTHKYKRVQGEDLEADLREPVFYDTLHSQYSHHMGQCHGVFKDSSHAETPFLGFTKQKLSSSSKGDYELACVCPYAEDDGQGKLRPCLSVFKANSNAKDGNCFKAYFRHVDSCHKHNAKNSKCIRHSNYLPDSQQLNEFIPLNMISFKDSLSFLQSQCHDSSVSPFELCQDLRILELLGSAADQIEGLSTSNPVIQEVLNDTLIQSAEDVIIFTADMPLIDDATGDHQFEIDMVTELNRFLASPKDNEVSISDREIDALLSLDIPIDDCPELEKDEGEFTVDTDHIDTDQDFVAPFSIINENYANNNDFYLNYLNDNMIQTYDADAPFLE